jgi:hypothetical protein
MAPFVQDVSVDHRRVNIFVAEQLLDGSDVVAGFEQMGCEGVPEGVAADVFDDSGFSHCFLHCSLEDRFVNVMSPLLAGLRVFPAVFLREDPLPAPFSGSVRVFAVEGVRKPDAPPALFQVFFVGRAGFCKVVL